MPREIIIEIPINQIKGLEKMLSASLILASGVSAVTPVTATKAIPIIDKAPIGIALAIMAVIIPINIAKSVHPSANTSSGTGMTKRMTKATAREIIAGIGLKPIEPPRDVNQ